MFVANFVDTATRFIMDPLSVKFSDNTQRLACVTTFVLTVLTGGLILGASAAWRYIRNPGEINTTHGFISDIFNRTFGQAPVEVTVEVLTPTERNSDNRSENTSIYRVVDWDSKIQIEMEVLREGLKEVPEFHLRYLSLAIEKAIKKEADPKISVTFLTRNLRAGVASDQGGPSRDYLNELCEGIVDSKTLSFKFIENTTGEASSYVLPETKEDYKNQQHRPSLEEQDRLLYEALGKVMMYCYHSEDIAGEKWTKTYSLGRHFDDALFHAALCLTAEEINTPFEDLTIETQLKMARALLEAHKKAGRDIAYLEKRINWLDKFSNLSQADLKEAAQTVCIAEHLSEELTIKRGEDDDEPDMEKIEKDKEAFKRCLIDSIFAQGGIHGRRGLGVQLAPIHAIARGMKSICRPNLPQSPNDDIHWNTTIRLTNSIDFSNKVQGLLLDRNIVADRIKLDPAVKQEDQPYLEKKVKWLQEWIKTEATEEELQNFIKFLTGSTSLPKDKEIIVIAQVEPCVAVPKAETCSLRMKLAPRDVGQNEEYNNLTKDNFIKALKELVLTDPSAYQTA
jgi:hypothetical protein